MAYRPKHFKIHTSIQNHRKTIGVFDDDSLLAMYVRAGILAIERFADRTDDSFLVGPRDLERLAGCRGVANARRKLGRLEATSPLTVCQEGAGYRLTIPNLKRKQGFKSEADPEAVTKRTPSSSPSSSPTTTIKKEDNGSPSATASPAPSKDGKSKAPKQKRPTKRPGTLCPERLDENQRESLLKWMKGRGLNESQTKWAFNQVKDWSHGDDQFRVDWVATIRKAVRKGWALDGYHETESERYRREMASSPFRIVDGGQSDAS